MDFICVVALLASPMPFSAAVLAFLTISVVVPLTNFCCFKLSILKSRNCVLDILPTLDLTSLKRSP